jgi:hypothetical protein
VQGFEAILADFLAPEGLSIQLKAFSDKGYSFFQQALFRTLSIFKLLSVKGFSD